MVEAYLDTHNNSIVDAGLVKEICIELGANPLADFDMVPLYRGGGRQHRLGRECRHCGAPLGDLDPDDCAWIMLGTCSDCRE